MSGGGFSGFAFDPGWSNVPPGIVTLEEKPGGFLVIYVVATLTIKPETRAEFIAAATACIKETRKEPGNIAYDLHESVTDPSKMVFVEQWENAEALVPHRAPGAHEDVRPCRREVLHGAAEDRSTSRPRRSRRGNNA